MGAGKAASRGECGHSVQGRKQGRPTVSNGGGGNREKDLTKRCLESKCCKRRKGKTRHERREEKGVGC